jgi:hypothetical protein
VHVYQGKFGENEKPRPYMFVMLHKVPLQLHMMVTLLALSSTVDVVKLLASLQKFPLTFQFRPFNLEFIASRAFTVRYKVN